jgi:hypothetical protein
VALGVREILFGGFPIPDFGLNRICMQDELLSQFILGCRVASIGGNFDLRQGRLWRLCKNTSGNKDKSKE